VPIPTKVLTGRREKVIRLSIDIGEYIFQPMWDTDCGLCICLDVYVQVMIEKENNFKQPGERYRSWAPDRQERFVKMWVDALSDARVTHEIRNIWLSYWTQVRDHILITAIEFCGKIQIIGTNTDDVWLLVT
jgi:hypothetical protein